MELTVVICTIRERRQLLGRCLWYLEHQGRDDFHVIIAHGQKRGKGDKLNLAFSLVETPYVMVLDDDDWLSERHMQSVLPILAADEFDFVGYDAAQMVVGRFHTVIPQETASHICPIRIDLARSVEFGNEYLSDIVWTKQVKKLVESETYIHDQLYYYDKWNPQGGTGWSPPRPVGYWPHDQTRYQWI